MTVLAAIRARNMRINQSPLIPSTLSMYCKSCSNNLSGLATESCPECARPFDHADPATFDVRPGVSRSRHLVGFSVGVGSAIVVGAATAFGFHLAWNANYASSPRDAVQTFLWIGIAGSFATALIAALSRSWLAWVPLLATGILCFWASLVLGIARYYQAWQSVPNPPEAAYADSGVLFPLVLGWIPGTIAELVFFGVCLAWCRVIFWSLRKPPTA